jgi:hypothetical protein
MSWDDLKRLQAERRRLDEFERQLDSPGALPGSRLHDVLQEHKRRLDARYARAIAAARRNAAKGGRHDG